VLSLDADSGDLWLLAVAGNGLPGRPGEIAFGRGQGLSGLAVQVREPLFSRDVLADPRLTLGRRLRERLSGSPIRSGLAVPMLAGDAVIGVLAVGDRARDFDDEEVRLVQAFAGQAAMAISNARLHEDVRGRLAHTETLLAVSEQLTAVVEPTEMMRRIAREICRAVGADMAGAFLADPEARHLRPIAGYHVPKHLVSDFLTHAIPLKGHQVLEEAWQRLTPVWSSDVPSDPRVNQDAWGRFPHRSSLFCPMIVQGKPIGGLFVTWWEARHEFTGVEVKLVEGISRQAGIAFANARLVEELRTRQGRLEVLIDAARELSRIQPQPTLLARIARACATLLASDSVGVRVMEGDELVLLGVWGDAERLMLKSRLKLGESLAGQVAAAGEPLLVANPDDDPRRIPEHRVQDPALRCRAYLGMPIKMGSQVLGVLSIETRRPEGFSAEDVAIASAFASEAAVALENVRLYQEVKDARDRLHALSGRLVESQEIERRHLARELHDEVGQALTGLKLMLQAGAAAATVPEIQAIAANTLELVQGLIERVRGLSLDLRPAMLDDLGLLPALVWHVERYTAQTKVQVRVEQSGLDGRRLDKSAETAVYRIVQEALTNVARHARVQDAVVRLWTGEATLYVQIEDEGIGFDAEEAQRAKQSSGLLGMRERAELVGGTLVIDARPGAGTLVTGALPLRLPAAGPGAAR
jgi:signal transduction histidine kinase